MLHSAYAIRDSRLRLPPAFGCLRRGGPAWLDGVTGSLFDPLQTRDRGYAFLGPDVVSLPAFATPLPSLRAIEGTGGQDRGT